MLLQLKLPSITPIALLPISVTNNSQKTYIGALAGRECRTCSSHNLEIIARQITSMKNQPRHYGGLQLAARCGTAYVLRNYWSRPTRI